MTHLQALDARISEERVLALAAGLCSIPSSRPDEGAVAHWLAGELARAGVEVQLQYVLPGRPNVIARVAGGSAPPLVLNGHIDASVHPAGWSRAPHEPWVEDGHLFGGGVTDMKGGVAAMAAAVEAAVGLDDLPGDLVLHAAMCHDTNGLGTKFLLAAGMPWSGYGICGEPSNLTVQTANGGAVKFEIEIVGRGAHISRMEGALDAVAAAGLVLQELNRFSFRFDRCERLPNLPRWLVGQIQGGEAPGAVAERASLRGDVRTVPGMTPQTVCADIEGLLRRTCPDGFQFGVRPLEYQRPFLGVTDGPLVDALALAHQAVRGVVPAVGTQLPGEVFVTDAADMAAFGIQTVVYGPGNWFFAPDEHVSIADLATAARVYLGTRLLLGAESV